MGLIPPNKYQYHVASVPRSPPFIVNTDESPKQIGFGVAVIEVGAIETTLISENITIKSELEVGLELW